MELNSVITKNIANHIQKLNLYILPKYIWLVLLYYLSLNTVSNLFFNATKNDANLINSVPVEAIKINTLILTEIEKWMPFIWFLCIAFFISGVSITFLKVVTSNIIDAEYGLHIGFWLFIIGITFGLYNFLGMFFIILIPFLALVKFGMKMLMEKFHISFG